MKNLLMILVATCALVSPVAGQGLKFGAYTSGSLAQLEKKVRQEVDMQAVFIGWNTTDADVPTTFPTSLKGTGKTLVIFWESSVERPFDKLLAGDWDERLGIFIDNAREYGDPIIFVPFHEMNGDWTTWSGTRGDNSPEKLIAAWRRLRGQFAESPNVLFGWAPNAGSFPNQPGNQIEDYYPGDEYVDIVGVDGFNFGNPWQTFDEVLGDALTRIGRYPKPLYIFSTASAEGPRKPEWIAQAFEGMPRYGVEGFIWFNEDKERDWRIWSNKKSLKAFRAGLAGALRRP